MDPHRPLSLVTPTLDGDVLSVLVGADHEFTAPTVHRLLGTHSESGVRRTLLRLTQQGIVSAGTVGRTTSYRLNRDHLGAKHIVALVCFVDELVEGIRNEIDAWPDPGLVPDAVALFGSAATGRMRPTSDIDLFVLQPDELLDTIGEGAELRQESWDHQLEWLRRVIGRWTGNDVRILDLSWHDLGRGMDSELRPVVRDIAEHGIWVIGSADLLRSNVDAR